MELADDFKPDDFEILYDNGRGKVIVAYGNSYKGSRTFHIRCLFEDANGKWRPAKEGVSVPLSDKAVFLAAIADKA